MEESWSIVLDNIFFQLSSDQFCKVRAKVGTNMIQLVTSKILNYKLVSFTLSRKIFEDF